MSSCNEWRVTVAVMCLGVLIVTHGSAAAQTDLEHARLMYNAGIFDEAIATAESARAAASTASSAALIIARARLERFRLYGNPDEVDQARGELVSLNVADLSRQELMEWQIGLAAALFFQQQYGAAAEWLRVLIPSARVQLGSGEVEKLLEWWAASTLQVAETLHGGARVEKYRELLRAMENEQQGEPWSRAATYWVIVASRGAGDFDRAWDEAIAGWIRAKALDRSVELRADIDRFVIETVIPERVQMRTGLRLDIGLTTGEVAAMTAEWKALTRRWSGEN
jgi:hypothetical protein